MKRIWLNNYPEGVGAEIDASEFSSVVDVFERSCEQFAERPAFSNMGRQLSYAELNSLTRDLAAYLQQRSGIQKGDRVAIMMPNLLQYPITLFAIHRVGAVVVNVNPLYTARELRHQLQDSGARAIFIVANFAHVLEEIIQETEVEQVFLTQLGDMLGFPKRELVNFVVGKVKKMVPPFQLPGAFNFRGAIREGAKLPLSTPDLTHDDLAFLQYTGGTTGVAKGAMLSHGNMVANMQQASTTIGLNVKHGEEIMISALPLYHIFCLTCNCLCFIKFGGCNVLITNPRDISGFVKELAKHKFTCISGVNTLYNALLNDAEFAKLDFSHLHTAVAGGMALQEAVAQRWHQVTGKHILEGYGLTETSPIVTVNPADVDRFTGSIGLPVPSTDVTLRNAEGEEVLIGEPGELWIKGPQVMQGYWQRPQQTAESLTSEGWFKTGDIASIDEQGFLRIVDRIKDMINVSGFNVYPNEIENAVALHEAVLEVACIGVPDEKSGEAVKIFVVKKQAHELTAEQITAHCRDNLTGYKVPRHIEFRTSLPKSNVGKILRRELRKP